MIEEAMSANCLKEIYLLEGEDNFTDLEPTFLFPAGHQQAFIAEFQCQNNWSLYKT